MLHTLRLTWLAVLLVIALAPHARALHHENRAGIFFSLVAHSRLAVAAQAVETHQQNPIYKEKTAAGIREYRARYYDPGLGRFLSEDPIAYATIALHGEKPGIVRGYVDINAYRYVFNSPFGFMDPSGRAGIVEWFKTNYYKYETQILLGVRTFGYTGAGINLLEAGIYFQAYITCIEGNVSSLPDCAPLLQEAIRNGVQSSFWVLGQLVVIKAAALIPLK